MEGAAKTEGARSSLVSGLGMVAFAILQLQHFFRSNYDVLYGWKGSVCDVSSWLNCNRFDASVLAQVGSIPCGYFGLLVGALVCAGAFFQSAGLQRTIRSVTLANLTVVIFLFGFSIFYLHSLCLWDAGYWAFSIALFLILRQRESQGKKASFAHQWLWPSLQHLAVFLLVFAVGAYAVRRLQISKRETMYVAEYFSLPKVKLPSQLSPYWVIHSSERFEDASIRIVEYSDLICDNSKYENDALEKLNRDFPGKMNVVFQFFPLEAKCNHVVNKDKHPGACEAAFMAAYDPEKFKPIQDQFFAHYYDAQKPPWRHELARQYGVEAAFTDARTQQIVRDLIQTGVEYAPTSTIYPHGIRSVPTLIVNDRMIIGTLSYDQLKVIFQAILDERNGKRQFIETWYDHTNDLLSWLFRVLNIVT
jgi:uncharacterized membrane protein